MSKFYHNKNKLEFRVGLTVLVIFAATVLGYAWLSNQLLLYKYQKIAVFFDNVDNIEPGSSVSIFGVKKGRVQSLDIQENGVLVTLQIEKSIPLKVSSKFIIRETDLMGNREVQIYPGSTGEIISADSKLQGGVEFGLSHLVSRLNKIIESTEKIVQKIEDDRSLFTSFEEIAKQTPILLDDLNLMIQKFETHFSSLTKQLNGTAENIDALIIENRENVKSTLKDAGKLFETLAKQTNNIEAISENTVEFTKKIKTNDSTVNRLISDKELYEKLMRTTTRLDSLVQDIQKNPEKYINISIF